MDLRIQNYPKQLYDAFLKKYDDAKNAGLFLNVVCKTETCKSMCSWSLLYSFHRLSHNPVVSFLLAIWCYCFSQTALAAAISGMESIIQQKIILSIWKSSEKECDSVNITQFRQGLCDMCHYSWCNDRNGEIQKYINEMSKGQLKALLNMMLIAVKRDYPDEVIDLDFLLDENHLMSVYDVLKEGITALAADSNIKVIDVLRWMDFFANRSIHEIRRIPRGCKASGLNGYVCAYGGLLEGAICSIFGKTTNVSSQGNKTTIDSAFSLLEYRIFTAGYFLRGMRYFPIGDTSQFITAYNDAIKCCVEQINVALKAENLEEITVESVQIRMP
jgi:hypothetical protein